MEAVYLEGVGKKIKYGYLNGKISEDILMAKYNKNKKEADAFSLYGYTQWEIRQLLKECSNPLLKKKMEDTLAMKKERKTISKEQNKTSIKKLRAFKKDACGMGLRKVIHKMKRLIKTTGDLELKATLLLLETEYANLSAKLHYGWHRKKIYERKTILLLKLADILKKVGWEYGVNCETGKNANYLVYIYMPNGAQLTWHCNEYNIYKEFPYIEACWDGQVAMTMEKILTYIGETYLHSK